jgi:hypothetical protein
MTGLSIIKPANPKAMETIQVTTRFRRRMSRRRVSLLLYLLVFTTYIFSTACKSTEQVGQSEQSANVTSSTPAQASASTISPVATETTSPSAPAEASELQPPTPEEVRQVVARVYQDAVTVDMSHPTNYLVGDFNGDGSQDIAVVVRPAADKLEEINSEVANWIVEDPRKVVLPDPHKSVQKLPPIPEPVKVAPNDLLLTIIHGYEKQGWRNPEAKQAYLLDNAVGSLMAAAPLKASQRANENKNNLSKSGDIIKESLAGESGFLYWTGAKYAWHKRQ